MDSEYPVFIAAQMLRFVNQDSYLTLVYRDFLKRGHASEKALEILFNGNVLEDSVMTREYELYAKEGERK
ncbi:hypothetical protein [Paenibacillus donghaensis]|uniref:Uncharacterized protein n=1 Tax=Paenibacillus donghaensis TaxID=414771 RepID=A0A2Z2K683_9BACL|nr:hypothetical protein [Paenibacillus donghaensis]ASA20244.1 hypothetical protein B9T62_05170 [Paenibacillus donghaensis]